MTKEQEEIRTRMEALKAEHLTGMVGRDDTPRVEAVVQLLAERHENGQRLVSVGGRVCRVTDYWTVTNGSFAPASEEAHTHVTAISPERECYSIEAAGIRKAN